jgi:ATP-dependent DNA helicase RecQ
MLDYLENDSTCKSMQLLAYFGETDVKPCGICSVCTQSKKETAPRNPNSLKKEIIALLEHSDLSSRILTEKLNCSEKEIQNVLQLMLEHNIIAITKTNTYKLYHL